jgi:glucose-1-phosphate thymidylyltransferase
MKGIILHGGHGTRLRPLTHTGPKQLLPIANKPMSEYCVESMIKAGIKEIAFIIGGVGFEKVREYYGTGERFGIKFLYIEQDSPKGIAHAIRLCKDFIGNEKFLVFLGDNIIQKSIKDYAERFISEDSSASILLCEVDQPSRFGIANIKDGQIIKIIEKPKNPTSNLAVTGIYFLTPLIFDVIDNLKPSWRNELEITDALQMLLESNHKIKFDIITNYWKDTGTPEDIIHANKVILENSESYFLGKKLENVSIQGKVMVGNGTLIKNNSKIEGPVIIGENCTIDENTRIGPNSSIGDNCKISQCDIEDSIVMENCIIDEKIKIRNSIIASNSSIKLNEKNDEKIFLVGEGTKILL